MATNPIPLSTVNSKVLPKMQRSDTWWIQPLATFVVFVAFIIYVTFRTFENANFEVANFNYLSPLYSPHIHTSWMIFGKHISPAIFILPVPLLFRGTCYYYRKAYYRAFVLDPVACGVSEAPYRKGYNGEKGILIVQNFHRYAFYLAAIVMVILWWDTLLTFTVPGPGPLHLTMRLGSLVFLVNVILLSMYTFSCHSFRHLSGGCMNCFSCSSQAKSRHTLWEKITHLNENHALWAWCSLFSVALTDLYVRSVALGAPIDFKIF